MPDGEQRVTKLDVYEFLNAQDLAVLGTLSRSLVPQTALVAFAVTPGLDVIFDTVKSSRKYANLAGHTKVSLVAGWTGEVTVQYEGEAEEPDGDARERYREIYFTRFPDGRERLSWPGIVHIVVHPKWIRYSDFNGGSRLIEEFRF